MYPDRLFTITIAGTELGPTLYGIMIALGLLACFTTLFLSVKLLNFNSDFVDFIFYDGIASIIVGFGSAALFQAVYNYIETGVWKFGAITFIGGLIGGAACFLIIYVLCRKRYNTRLCEVVSYLPCCILIAHAFGRIGCLFAGCCHGTYLGETYVFGGIKMNGGDGWGYYIPTQLYEALFLFIMFGVIFYLVVKRKYQHGLSLYLFSYGIFRFVIEFFRDDHRGEFVGSISPSQFWSLLMIPLAFGVYFLHKYFLKKRAEELKANPSGFTDKQ